MERLSIKHLGIIQKMTERMPLKTFYHYPPIILGLSESDDSSFQIDELGGIWSDVDKGELFIGNTNIPEEKINKVVVSSIPSIQSSNYRSMIYDVNFIYDLNVTTDIKNFKANVKKFEQRSNDYRITSINLTEAKEILRTWYKQRKGQEFSDFGYTLYLAQHWQLFDDIHAEVVIVDKKPVLFSLWGELDRETTIHIVSKDTGQCPYVQDYYRMQTYNKMMDEGYRYCNDGSSLGIHELHRYKMKLRPWLIVPVWSWIRKETV